MTTTSLTSLRYILRGSLAFDQPDDPARVCIVKWYEGGRFYTYSTHLEILPPGQPGYLVLGRYYYRDLPSARRDYERRLRQYDTTDDPEAWMPEDVQYDMEDSPQIYKDARAGYHTCIGCKHLEEHGTPLMIDACNHHRQHAMSQGKLGSQHYRFDPAKIIPRKCQAYQQKMVPAEYVTLRIQNIRNQLKRKEEES